MNQESTPLRTIVLVSNIMIVGDNIRQCKVKCPHCKNFNKHGLGKLGEPHLWGHRACDWCTKGYEIQKSPI